MKPIDRDKVISQNYRRAQFNKLKSEYSEYKTKIKIIKPDGETHWMDIEEEELQSIKELLTR